WASAFDHFLTWVLSVGGLDSFRPDLRVIASTASSERPWTVLARRLAWSLIAPQRCFSMCFPNVTPRLAFHSGASSHAFSMPTVISSSNRVGSPLEYRFASFMNL